jgi:hypothetical protein
MMIGVIIGTLAVVLVTVSIGLLIDSKLPILPRPDDKPAPKRLPAHAPGEAPATALRLVDAQLAKLRAAQRCPECRAAMREEPEELVRYDETDLRVLHFGCTICSGKRSLYVRAP